MRGLGNAGGERGLHGKLDAPRGPPRRGRGNQLTTVRGRARAFRATVEVGGAGNILTAGLAWLGSLIRLSSRSDLGSGPPPATMPSYCHDDADYRRPDCGADDNVPVDIGETPKGGSRTRSWGEGDVFVKPTTIYTDRARLWVHDVACNLAD